MQAASHELNLRSGAIRRIYTLDGRPVRSLTDFTDNGLYVATGGEPFKPATYPIYADDDTVQNNDASPGSSPTSPTFPRHPNWVAGGGRHVLRAPLPMITSAAGRQFGSNQQAREDEKEIPIFTQTVRNITFCCFV